MTSTVKTAASTNITVYHGTAFSAVYGPKTDSAVVPNMRKNLSQSGFV